MVVIHDHAWQSPLIIHVTLTDDMMRMNRLDNMRAEMSKAGMFLMMEMTHITSMIKRPMEMSVMSWWLKVLSNHDTDAVEDMVYLIVQEFCSLPVLHDIIDLFCFVVVMMFYCYIITNGKNTYNGYTNNLVRRLRQHNGELVGGARATRGKGVWRYVCVLCCETWNACAAMSMEWHIKYPTNKRPRPPEFQGPLGRLKSLPLAIGNSKDPRGVYTLYVADEYGEYVPGFGGDDMNVVVMEIGELGL